MCVVFFMNSTKARAAALAIPAVEKCPTGIAGLDEITLGGLPKGRPTLLCGSAGCGKTLLAMTFLTMAQSITMNQVSLLHLRNDPRS